MDRIITILLTVTVLLTGCLFNPRPNTDNPGQDLTSGSSAGFEDEGTIYETWQTDVKFISIDGNYDYETIYYEYDGVIFSNVNMDYQTQGIHKGDSVRLTLSLRDFEYAEDIIYPGTEIVTDIELLNRGKLSRFLETGPRVEARKLTEYFGSVPRELVPIETALFIACAGNPKIAEALSWDDDGYFWYESYFTSPDNEPTDEDPIIYCDISYTGNDHHTFVVTIGLSPDYNSTKYYVFERAMGFLPVYFCF